MAQLPIHRERPSVALQGVEVAQCDACDADATQPHMEKIQWAIARALNGEEPSQDDRRATEIPA